MAWPEDQMLTMRISHNQLQSRNIDCNVTMLKIVIVIVMLLYRYESSHNGCISVVVRKNLSLASSIMVQYEEMSGLC